MKKAEDKNNHSIGSDLERFNSEILANPELQERLKAATNPNSLINLVVELSQEKGYLINKEEIIAALATETSLGKDYQEDGVLLKSGSVVAGCGCGGNPPDVCDDCASASEDAETQPCLDEVDRQEDDGGDPY